MVALDTELCLPALQLMIKLLNFCTFLIKWNCRENASVFCLLELNPHLLNLVLKALVAHLCFNKGEVELKGLHVPLPAACLVSWQSSAVVFLSIL